MWFFLFLNIKHFFLWRSVLLSLLFISNYFIFCVGREKSFKLGKWQSSFPSYQCHFAPRIHDFLLFPKCQKYRREKAHKLTKESIPVSGENKISSISTVLLCSLISLCCWTAIYEMGVSCGHCHMSMKAKASISY